MRATDVRQVHKKAARRSFSTAALVGTLLGLLERYVPAWHSGVPTLVSEVLPVVVGAVVGYLAHNVWVEKLVALYEELQ